MRVHRHNMQINYSMFTRVGLVIFFFTQIGSTQNEGPEYWLKVGREELMTAQKLIPNTNQAKNVIIFIGDGMGVSTVTAARIYKGQRSNKPGEETVLEFEKFPHVGLLKTYLPDRQVSDSAATATAMLSGVKTNWYYVGVNGDAKFEDCDFPEKAKLNSILHQSGKDGKSTGIVTTTRITHATPASGYAHVTQREWEGDTSMLNVTGRCKDIAHQLVYENSHLNVIFGGGRQWFIPEAQIDPEVGNASQSKQRKDGLNLIREWQSDKKRKAAKFRYVWNKGDFDSLDSNKVDYVLGLFEPSHMKFEFDRDNGPNGEPSLPEMTRKAIQILQKNPSGFTLLVEGGRIDHAHHANKAKRALHETVMFDEAVKTAVDMTDEQETLIIVTADHSHVFNIAGYPKRGNDILGVVDPLPRKWYPFDNKAYTTLLYANGPGFKEPRVEPLNVDTKDNDYLQTSAVPLADETHGGEDIPVYAQGPWAHLIHGVHEQNYVYHVMSFASCVGLHKQNCAFTTNDADVLHSNCVQLIILMCLMIVVNLKFIR